MTQLEIGGIFGGDWGEIGGRLVRDWWEIGGRLEGDWAGDWAGDWGEVGGRLGEEMACLALFFLNFWGNFFFGARLTFCDSWQLGWCPDRGARVRMSE